LRRYQKFDVIKNLSQLFKAAQMP